jgi:CotS family spore coat protein
LESAEFDFYETLNRFGIQPKVIDLLPDKPQRIVPYYDDGYILEFVDGDLVLWVHHGSEASLACQTQILKICMQEGLTGFLYPVQLIDGLSYAELNNTCWFYLTPWPKLQKVHFSDVTDLKAIVNLLASFRRIIHDNGFLFCLPEKQARFNLIDKYREIYRQLNSFQMLAKHRLGPTAFDRQFLCYLPEAMDQIKRSLTILENTNYLDVITQLTPQDIIMNRLTRHNLRMRDDGKAVCIQLNDYRWDLPIIDLAIFLIKTGQSSKWDTNWFKMIFQEYERHFAINMLERQVVHAYVSFPWSFYRLASRYYYNRVDWTIRTFVEKMGRVLEDEVDRTRFIDNYRII